MALIDVSDLLSDPDFVSYFIIVRSIQSVDNHGRIVEQSVSLPGVGSIQPADDRTYQMFPEAARVSGSIEVYTRSSLTPPTLSFSADEILWKGKVFTVMGVLDFTNYGAGHNVALCALKALTAPGSTYNTNTPIVSGNLP